LVYLIIRIYCFANKKHSQKKKSGKNTGLKYEFQYNCYIDQKINISIEEWRSIKALIPPSALRTSPFTNGWRQPFFI
jgi:hypothetical protein